MTVWFAQNSSVNINSANEWNDVAAGGGNVLTWASLAAGDVLCANGKTAIAINVNVTCLRLSTDAEVGSSDTGTTGGGFTCAETVTINADILAGGSACITTPSTVIKTVTINFNTITGGSATGSYAVYRTRGGVTFVLNGDTIIGGSNATGHGFINTQSGGNTTINANISGSETSLANGIGNAKNDASAITVVGNLINTNTAFSINGPITYNPGTTNYIQLPVSTTESVKLYFDVPDSGNVTQDDSVAGVTGTYVEPTEAQVQDGVHFGALSVLLGTYVGEGGSGRPEIRGSNL